MTDEARSRRAHCNTCGGARNHKELGSASYSWQSYADDPREDSGTSYFYILQCQGCEDTRFLHERWTDEQEDNRGKRFSIDTYYPPSTFRPLPRWCQQLPHKSPSAVLLLEVYRAMQNDAPALAAMGIRAIIEMLIIEKVGDQGTFAKNLQTFCEKGFISKVQLSTLEAALEIGHASIHRGFTPSLWHLELALDIAEALLQQLYLLTKEASYAVRTVPPRKGRAPRT